MSSSCNICLGEEPERELLDLPCAHRICRECHEREAKDTPCQVYKFCEGKPILYEKEPLTAGIVRWERKLERVNASKITPFADIAGYEKLALSQAILSELQKDFVPANNRFFAGRAMGKPCYFEVVDDALIEYYHAGSKMWQVPIMTPVSQLRKKFKVVDRGLLITHDTYSSTITRSGAVWVGRTGGEAIFDWDTGITILGESVCLDGIYIDISKRRLGEDEIYDKLPPIVAELERLTDIRARKIKAIEANLEVLKLHESFAAAGHSSLLPKLARRQPKVALEKPGLVRVMDVGKISSIRPFTSTHFMIKYGETYVLPHETNPQVFDLGGEASWTVNHDCLSLWLPKEKKWVGVNFVTGEPMEPDPVQRVANFKKYVPKSGEFCVWGNDQVFLNSKEWH